MPKKKRDFLEQPDYMAETIALVVVIALIYGVIKLPQIL